ncbi:hypothetical protein VTN00DRAFT_9934 [Thermoascus crustaceus]|uniref:uncharacterized protein n=1 Tax=Thermoascus crustaceus TaxID=5088 RepID=UPI003743033C
MDEVDFQLCLDVEHHAAISRREREATQTQKTATAGTVTPLFETTCEKTPKAGKARRAHETMDDISDDTTLMPPPNKRARTAEKYRPSKEEEEDQDLVNFPKFDSDELAQQFFEDLELHGALDLSVSPVTCFQSTTTFTEGIYYAQDHYHRSPLAPLRQELAAGWIEPTCSRKRKFTTTFEIYEDPADVEISWPSSSQFDPTNDWYASASDDKENMSDHGGYEQMAMDIDDMEDDGYPSHERRNRLRGEEEYDVSGGSHHGIHILESPGQQSYYDHYNHQEHTEDNSLEDYTENDMDAARIFDDIFFPESSTSSSSFSSGSSRFEIWAEYSQVSPPPPPPPRRRRRRAYGPPRNRPRAHDFF